MKPSNKRTMTWVSLLFCAISANMAYAQAPIAESVSVIKEGVQTIKVYADSIIVDTIPITEFIEQQPKDLEQRNRNLRLLNEQMKEPE